MNAFQIALSRAGLDRSTTTDAGAILYLVFQSWALNSALPAYTGPQPLREAQRILRENGLLDTYAGRWMGVAALLESLAAQLDR